MFTEEVGVSPIGADGGAAYRARVAELIRAGRSFARIENGQVVFKAEIGAVTPQACQVQGVWVPPELRGRGHASARHGRRGRRGMRCRIAPVVSRCTSTTSTPRPGPPTGGSGFTEAGTFMSVLF